MVHLKVDYNVIVARLSGRRQCPTCGALYSVTSNAPSVAEACDYDGSKLVIREDDREEVVRERLRAYERQTEPVLDYLKSAGYAFLEIEGDWKSATADRGTNWKVCRGQGKDRERKSMIVRKNMSELEKMRAAGLLVWKILDRLRNMVAEGVTTYDLEQTAEKMMADAGARPAFKGYSTAASDTKFPFVLCTSVNDEIVHGMPSQKRIFEERRYCLHRYGGAVERVLRRLSRNGGGRRYHGRNAPAAGC